MFFKIRKKKEEENSSNKQQLEITEEDLELTDEEFFLAEEIDGYSCCEGMNAERCSSECFKAVMMPTVTVIS